VLISPNPQAEVVKRDLLPAHHPQVMEVEQERRKSINAVKRVS
jgi:hypothetical protein